MITFDENYLINKNSEGLNKVIPQRKFEIVNKEEEDVLNKVSDILFSKCS